MNPPWHRSRYQLLAAALVFTTGVAATPQAAAASGLAAARFFLPTAVAQVAPPPPPSPSADNFTEIPLLGGLLHKGDYAVAATLGGQALRLKVDSATGSVMVGRAGCEFCPTSIAKYDDAASPAATGAANPSNATVVACGDPMCGAETPGSEPDGGQCKALDCKECSDTGACCAPDQVGDCWFARAGRRRAGTGRLGRDVLALAGAGGGDGVTANVTFGGMDIIEGPIFPNGADGTLGIGLDPSACEPSCTRPFAAEVGAGDGGVGVCVNLVGGALTFGGVNESHIAPGVSMSWFDVTPLADKEAPDEPPIRRKWLTPVASSMRVGTATVDAPAVKTALWTTVTPFLALSPTLFVDIFKELQKGYCDLDEHLCGEHTWFTPQSCLRLPDSVMEGMPNLTFTVGGPDDAAPLDVVVTPEDYLLPYPQGDKLYHCLSLVAVSMDSRDEQLIFGTSVLRKYVSYFDRVGARLGLAPASGACGSSVPSEEGLMSTDADDGAGSDARSGGSALDHKAPLITADGLLGEAANSSESSAADGGANTDGTASPDAVSGGEDATLGMSPAGALASCAAHTTCAGCAAADEVCAYNIKAGTCQVRDPTVAAVDLPYPLCVGGGCVCSAATTGGGLAPLRGRLGTGLGVAVVVAITAAVGWWCWRARRRRREAGGSADPYALVVDEEASDEGFDVLGRLPR
ncbi:hypothetical protein BU14_0116s0039 [Porphyra umbilicalis]|uniref:Peptidase A1 domain-containing protein n=1 Tax=Porphyra umbilicalis TaxID=2786 RepID=A0A1X6PBU7_PORUM|nr:hypothetical protein BU14_0116s0039 [Porphyra umbilicalis]|eukprot:OSX78220.1 hypothetical protein BU14_0116s0039 [Porphyra umbilicalis]